MARSAAPLNVPIRLQPDEGPPLHRQLADQLRAAVTAGLLPPGQMLPSTRTLADSLGVSRTVALNAYAQLYSEGYLTGKHGSGTYVAAGIARRAVDEASLSAPDLKPGSGRSASTALDQPLTLSPSAPSVDSLPLDVWRRIWRHVGDDLPEGGHGAPAGNARLRIEVAHYLRRVRGLLCQPDDVIVTAGASHAFELIARAALLSGRQVGVEDPGYPRLWPVLRAQGAELLPLSVDDDGLLVNTLPVGRNAPAAVFLTPSHQCPLGGRLPVSRRSSLLAWADRQGTLLVEDDYDSEFRFGVPPLPAMASLDKSQRRVVYVGTFSKVLTPQLRLGYVVCGGELRDRLLAMKAQGADHIPVAVQEAVAKLLADGELDRHIRRMRREYARRREVLVRELEPLHELGSLRGLEAGLQVWLELSPEVTPGDVVARAGQLGVSLMSLDACYLGPPTRHGLVLGYANLRVDQLAHAAEILRSAIQQAAGRRGARH
jgi:GntR family transcriptional regulator / MocR family aminotransferase